MIGACVFPFPTDRSLDEGTFGCGCVRLGPLDAGGLGRFGSALEGVGFAALFVLSRQHGPGPLQIQVRGPQDQPPRFLSARIDPAASLAGAAQVRLGPEAQDMPRLGLVLAAADAGGARACGAPGAVPDAPADTATSVVSGSFAGWVPGSSADGETASEAPGAVPGVPAGAVPDALAGAVPGGSDGAPAGAAPGTAAAASGGFAGTAHAGASACPVLRILDEGAATVLELTHDTARISHATALDFLQKIDRVLGALATAPDIACGALDLRTDVAAALMPDLSRPLAPRPQEPVAATFFAVAGRHPGRPAIAAAAGRYSYADLSGAARAIAADLRNAGLKPGDIVAVAGLAGFGTYAAMLAVLAAGGVLVLIDRALPEARQQMLSTVAAPRLTIDTGSGAVDAAALRYPAWPDADQLATLTRRAPDADTVLADLPDDASAYIFFTSGSTGAPKGVLGTHRGLAHFLAWQRATFPLGPEDHAAQLTALSFDVVLRDILFPLTSGACLHVPAPGMILDARGILAWIEAEAITGLHAVPSLMRAWLRPLNGETPLAGLRFVFFAGEPLTDTLLTRLRLAAAPGLRIVNLYGPTETTLAKLCNPIDRIEPGVQPVGRPQPGAEVIILRDRKTPCGLWETGEIAIRSPYRSKGYYGNDALTRSVFVPNPQRDDPGDRIYLTGDLGRYRPDGKIEIFGRSDSQIKIRGVRIEPAEVEGAMAALPGVRDAAVTTRPGANGAKILIGLLVPDRPLPEPARAEAAAALRARLAATLHDAMVPTRIVFADSLPYLPNGKVDRKAIGALPLEAPPVKAPAGFVDLDPGRRAVIDGIEAALSVLITDLDRSFIELGGDSLSFIEVSILLEEHLGDLPEGWEAMPLSALLAARREGRKPHFTPEVWVGVEIPILLRAIAIVLVIASYTPRFPGLHAYPVLFLVSGLTFAKFMRPPIRESGDTWAVWRMILKFGIPAALWIAVSSVLDDRFWLPDFILMGTFFQRAGDSYMTFWFLDVLAANMAILALISWLEFRIRRHRGVSPLPPRSFVSDVIAAALFFLVAYGQVQSGWWNGRAGIESVAPFKYLWMMALGILIFSADTRPRKLAATGVVAFIAVLVFAGPPYTQVVPSRSINLFFVVSALVLIWIGRLRMPRLLQRSLSVVAASTLFIYIVGHHVVDNVMPSLGVTHWFVKVAAAVALGIALRVVWDKLVYVVLAFLHRTTGKVQARSVSG